MKYTTADCVDGGTNTIGVQSAQMPSGLLNIDLAALNDDESAVCVMQANVQVARCFL